MDLSISSEIIVKSKARRPYGHLKFLIWKKVNELPGALNWLGLGVSGKVMVLKSS